MELIRAIYQGDKQNPLGNAKKFVLEQCGGSVDAIKHWQCFIAGHGFITDTQYIVDIAVDGGEVRAFFRWPPAPQWSLKPSQPSKPGWPILEILFFQTAPACCNT